MRDVLKALDNIDYSIDEKIKMLEKQIAAFSGVAENIGYTHHSYPDIENVKQALDKLLYVDLAVKSFKGVPADGYYDMGSVVNPPIVLNWEFNGPVKTQSINNNALGRDVRTYTHSARINSNTDFVLRASDDNKNVTKTIFYRFTFRRFWGVSSATSYNAAFLNALGNNSLGEVPAIKFTANAQTGQYIYFACPTSYKVPEFWVLGFEGGFFKAGTVNYTNKNGISTEYSIYRSDHPGLGLTDVEVK